MKKYLPWFKAEAKNDSLSDNIFPTYFRVVKSRIGLRPNYAMLCNFNLTKRTYEDKYKIVKLDVMGNILPELAYNQLPKWAKGKYDTRTEGRD